MLQTRSISLVRTDDDITEPETLRRADGSSVYHRLPDPTCSPPPDPGRGAATRRGRWPHRRPRPGRWHRRVGAAGIRRQRERPRRGTGRSGSFHVHLRGAAAAGDRARRRRENHRHAHPGSRVARQRRPSNRVGPVRRRGGATPRPHRCTGRNVGQAHLVHPPQ